MTYAEIAPILKALFGKSSRVMLALWILNRRIRPFYVHEAQSALSAFGIAQSMVSSDLATLLDLQLLLRFPESGRVYYQATDSPLWNAFAAIGDATETWKLFETELQQPSPG